MINFAPYNLFIIRKKMDNDSKNKDTSATAAQPEAAQTKPPRSSALAWVALVLTLLAWAALLWFNGYAALAVAALAVVAGLASLPHTRISAKRLATTAIIASLVLIVVVSAYLVVLKIGLG